MNHLDRMEAIYDLNLDLPGAKVATVRRYSQKGYRSADWKADDRRALAAIAGAVLLLAGMALVISVYAG
jgi:hypothetical protein